MIFWVIWICGLILTIITFKMSERYIIKSNIFTTVYSEVTPKIQALAIVSMIMYDSLIPSGMFYMTMIRGYIISWSIIIFFIIIILAIVMLTISFETKVDFFNKKISKRVFRSSFFISIIGWLGIFHIYNLNIELVTETFTETEERELLSFNNVPIKDVSGHIGRFYGEITSTDEIPYWYLDGNTNEGLYDSALPSDSRIKLIGDDETSYLEIVTSTTVTTEYNNYNGTQRTLLEETSEEYKFYLPESQFDNSNN